MRLALVQRSWGEDILEALGVSDRQALQKIDLEDAPAEVTALVKRGLRVRVPQSAL